MNIFSLLKKSLLASLGAAWYFSWIYLQNHEYFVINYEVFWYALGSIFVINFCFCIITRGKIHFPSLYANCTWLLLFTPFPLLTRKIDLPLRILLLLLTFSLIKVILSKNKQKLDRFLCFILGMLWVFNGCKIGFQHMICQAESKKILQGIQESFVLQKNEKLPNIYWIIADSYTSSDVLSSFYDLDVSSFISQLEKVGFKNYPQARTNSFPTLKSLTNATCFPKKRGEMVKNQLILYFLFRQNPFFKNLNTIGYTLYYVPSRFPFLQKLENIDKVLDPQRFVFSEFLYAIFQKNNSLGSFFASSLNRKLFQRTLSVFKQIEQLPSPKNNTFFYIHLDLPHAPFIFSNNFEFYNDLHSTVWGENSATKNGYKQNDYRTLYPNNILALNHKLTPLLKNLVSSNNIVILQGDHGTFSSSPPNEKESSSILLLSNFEQWNESLNIHINNLLKNFLSTFHILIK